MLTAGQRVWGGSAPRGEAAELCPGNARTAVERSRTAIPAVRATAFTGSFATTTGSFATTRPGQLLPRCSTARWKEQTRPGAPRERNQVLRRRPPRPAYPADRAFPRGIPGHRRGTHSGGNRNEVLHGMRRSRPRPAVLHALRRGVKSPARPGRRPVPDHHRSRPDPSRTGPGGAARPALGPAGITRARPVRIRSAAGPAVPSRSARGAAAFA